MPPTLFFEIRKKEGRDRCVEAATRIHVVSACGTEETYLCDRSTGERLAKSNIASNLDSPLISPLIGFQDQLTGGNGSKRTEQHKNRNTREAKYVRYK